MLKDYVNGKLLYCHPPPGISDASFNQRAHELALLRAVGKKQAPVTRVGKSADTFVAAQIPASPNDGTILPGNGKGLKTQALDHEFFENNALLSSRPFVQGSARNNGAEFSRSRAYPHQNAVANDGTSIGGRRARLVAVLANQGSSMDEGKKHHKKLKRVKQRSGKGYD